MKILFFIIFFIFCVSVKAQTVIEMMSPQDADVVLLKTNDSTKADIVVFVTNKKEQFEKWDCSWKIKKWGFSNFSIYIALDTNELIIDKLELSDDNFKTDSILKYHGIIYFTTNYEFRGYKNPNFRLPGVLKITKKNK